MSGMALSQKQDMTQMVATPIQSSQKGVDARMKEKAMW